ncbi:hypothetical protein M3175_09825 [Robertmurraya korlensis]|uniref:hypothetical protein n=1 Tax=Robertmurraya korlensis TaxID=519977 RepID=UPI002040B859|nr:hypothetical protein [Robertmurraya korlensis]MCM3601029.1 hypothetical protein [Robertmurraya korlensis]
MRKVILKALPLLFISVLLYGCQFNENISTNSATENLLSIDSDVKSVSISKTKGFHEITFSDQKSLEAFHDIFSSAGKEPGIVNMADPEFYLKVNYDNENHQDFYVWIGEKGQRSTFMKTEDTHTIYTVSEEKTDHLIELVQLLLK